MLRIISCYDLISEFHILELFPFTVFFMFQKCSGSPPFFLYLMRLCILLLSPTFLASQDKDQQFEFVVSNDKFADQDRYFTSGLYLSYQKLLNKKLILPKTTENKLQLKLSIGDEIYSPTSISSFDTKDFDRPFAGWLFGKMEVASIKERSALFLALETGITGEESLAGSLQTGLHEVFGIDSRPSWVEEIEFKWLVNIKLMHSTNWSVNNKNAFQYTIGSSLGTKDIYLENDLGYFFGKFNKLRNSARIGALDETLSNEFFGFVAMGYKYVAHNTLIQGSLFKDDVLFTTAITHHVFKARAGVVLKIKRNLFKVMYDFNTSETPLATAHVYGSLAYARTF